MFAPTCGYSGFLRTPATHPHPDPAWRQTGRELVLGHTADAHARYISYINKIGRLRLTRTKRVVLITPNSPQNGHTPADEVREIDSLLCAAERCGNVYSCGC